MHSIGEITDGEPVDHTVTVRVAPGRIEGR